MVMVTGQRRRGIARYRPAKGTKRYYVFEAMKRSGTPDEIHQRAVEIARKEGVQLAVEDFHAVNVNFLAQFLRKKGYAITHRMNTIRIS